MTRPYLPNCAGWPIKTLEPDSTGEVVVEVSSGGTPSTDNSAFWGGSIPWLTPKEVTGIGRYRFVGNTERTLTSKGLRDSAAQLIPAGSVLLTKRAPVGAVVMNEIPLSTNQGFLNFRTGKLLRPDYLYWWLSANTPYLETVANGSTYPELYPSDLFEFQIALPPISEQSAITGYLNDLDDKIELNRRISETLEAIARALFKSWFEDFDPVRAKMEKRWRRGQSLPGLPADLYDLFPDRLVDSELGEIPDEWKVVSLPQLVEINPIRALRKGHPALYLDMAHMPTQGHAPSSVIERPFSSGMRFINGDTLIARITPCLENGKTAFVDFLQDKQIGWGSTEYIVLRAIPPLPEEFAYCLSRSDVFREFAIQSMTGTSGRQRVPPDALAYFKLVQIPDQISHVFSQIIKPLFVRSSNSVSESRTLAAIRDSLLPKLISGQLRVKDAEKFIERVA